MTAVNGAVQMFMRGRGYVIIGSWNLQRDVEIYAPLPHPPPVFEVWILLELNGGDSDGLFLSLKKKGEPKRMIFKQKVGKNHHHGRTTDTTRRDTKLVRL